MKFRDYVKDKMYAIILFLVFYIMLLLLLVAFKSEKSLVIAVSILFGFLFLLLFFIDFYRKKFFYDKLSCYVKKLDQKYLVLEMMMKPSFYEGCLLYEMLYEINKSMMEKIKQYKFQTNDFKEYVEMWIHEVKVPISSLVLMEHNHKDIFHKRALEQIRRIEDYVEQILYYVRSEHAEKDYLINEVLLQKVISVIALKYKDDLLENKIDLCVEVSTQVVLTDSKWLEFIISQIVSNSIKYKDEKKSSYIKISTEESESQVVLFIEDNGIGIPKNDIRKVFDKSFTGHNGRIKTKSTGMGLFIAKKLCSKLGHKIEIASKECEYTRVSIIFLKNNYYDVVK